MPRPSPPAHLGDAGTDAALAHSSGVLAAATESEWKSSSPAHYEGGKEKEASERDAAPRRPCPR